MRITGTTKEMVEKTRKKVEQIISDEQRALSYQNRAMVDVTEVRLVVRGRVMRDAEQVISVPSGKVGLVMGRGGETIRKICLVSGAHCQVDKTAPLSAKEKNILIKGRPDAVERAKVRTAGVLHPTTTIYFQNMVNEAVSGTMGRDQDSDVMTDFRPQWVEYYRSLGMEKEAEIIEQEISARAQSSPLDYSAQWAQYYRYYSLLPLLQILHSSSGLRLRQSRPN